MVRTTYLVCFGLFLGLTVIALPKAAAAEWRTYTNVRFGFSVEYPAHLLQIQPPPANNDGRAFRSHDGQVGITASAGFNVLRSTVKGLYRESIAEYGHEHVTFKKLRRNWFVVSGVRAGSLFYEFVAIVRKGDAEVTGRLTAKYPVLLKPLFDRVVTRMQRRFSRSFQTMPIAR
jgi:hypothetical protein